MATGLTVVALATWFAFTGYNEWHKSLSETNFCSNASSDFRQHFRYIQLTIDQQSLRNPIFDGRYYINLGNEFGKSEMHLQISQAGHGNYGATTLRPQFYWNDDHQNLVMRDTNADISFVSPEYTSHYMFPFDSTRFDETFSFDPAIDIRAVLFLNRVAGFYIPCNTILVRTKEGSANISFELRRNPLIVYTAVLLLIVVAFFAIFITLFVEPGPLPAALASYFFAVWSIRALFGLTAEVFLRFSIWP